MPMKNPNRPAHSSRLRSLARSSLPAFCVAAALTTSGCLFGSPGPSNVSQGEQYSSGDATFDQFFSQLFLVQLKMGEAPARQSAIRARLARAGGVDAAASTNDISAAIETRDAKIAMSGVKSKIAATGLDGTGPATATVVTTGSGASADDTEFLATLDACVKDEAALLSDLRASKPSMDALGAQAATLEPGIGATFYKGGAPKKAEVRKNLEDAEKLIPLMDTRDDQVAGDIVDILKKLEHALGTTTPAPVPEPTAAPEPAKPARKSSSSHPSTTRTTEAPAPKPAAEKPPPAASDGFQP